jgi:hypothetical protein
VKSAPKSFSCPVHLGEISGLWPILPCNVSGRVHTLFLVLFAVSAASSLLLLLEQECLVLRNDSLSNPDARALDYFVSLLDLTE